MSTTFIGLDAGGTRTRALAATAEGRIVGRGSAAGANAWSSGSDPARSITAATAEALGTLDPSTVGGAVIAVAGAVSSVPEQAQVVIRAWRGLGFEVEPRIILDVVAAYAAGTTRPRGLVLAAGTGAIAALVDGGELVRRSGGRGWLVGDEGSAVWIGIEGVRAVLLALDGRGPATSLSGGIRVALGVDPGAADPATVITDAIYARSPAALGRLAPLVVDGAEAGDRVSRSIVDAAAGHLVGTAAAAAGDEDPAVVVIAGSLLTRSRQVGDLVRASLTERWPRATVVESVSGEAGATALAIGWATGTPVSALVLESLRR